MDAQIVFVAVVAGRFLLPLLIFRYPLPAIIGCLVLDGVDQTIFQAFGYDPPGYQGYDKAMDVFYLAIAYIAMMRNWTSVPAFRIGRFLYFYRLVGVVAFELLQVRALLLVFPNTFEYFFIAYEAIRLRWDPSRFGMRFWLAIAAFIWVVVKLPQEWWIHIAKLDLTDALDANPWGYAVIVLLVVVAAVLFRFVLMPRLGPVDHSWRVVSDPLPQSVDDASELAAWQAHNTRVFSAVTLEKVALVGLIAVVYSRVLPDLRSTTAQVFVAIAVLVVINAAISLWAYRAARTVQSIYAAFAVRIGINLALIAVADWLLGPSDRDLNRAATVFFVLLLSLLTLLHDRYLPVHRVRALGAESGQGAPGEPGAVSRSAAG